MDKRKYNIGLNIRTARTSQGLTQTELGKLLNTSQHQISKYEKNEQSMSVKRLVEISEALGVSPAELFGTEKGKEKVE
jgi:transcriptional regulator with XRE-family HTH domain